MNRIFLSLAMLMSLACNRVESLDGTDNLTPDTPLGISVSALSFTKGGMVEEPEDMGSVGLYCAQTGDDEWSGTTEFLKLNNRRFYVTDDGDWVIDGDSETWGYNTIYDKYTIFAYSPHSSDMQGVTPTIVNGELTLKYIVPSSSLDQPDLMYAVPRKNIYPQMTGSVSLNFCHTLSSVGFSVVSSVDTKILAIDVEGVINEGTLLHWDDEDGVPEWSLSDSADGQFSVDVESYLLDDDNSAQVNSQQGYLMMIPQELTSGARVTLTLDNGRQRTLTIPAGSVWEAGLKYDYIIRLDEDDNFIFSSDEISNCYIIHPTEGEDTIVQIPIQDRINDFWVNYAERSEKIETSSDFSDYNVIMIWEDFDDDVDFGYEFDRDADNKMVVRLTIPAKNQEGNFVFAVNEVDSDGYATILWSWHLWFTDYDPDTIAARNINNIVAGEDRAYTLTGYEGAVHRYVDAVDTLDVWSAIGIYKDKFIMDRNIGERNEYPTNYGAGSVYYEYGRKDPFPGNYATYSVESDGMGVRILSGFPYNWSVIFAADYFTTGSSSSTNWCGETDARNALNIWFDGDIPAENYTTGKSIFDPSPLGWRVPVSDTWSYFNTVECSSASASVGKYQNYSYRDPVVYGGFTSTEGIGYVWSANQSGAEMGYGFCYTSSKGQTPVALITTYGLPVRAVQE